MLIESLSFPVIESRHFEVLVESLSFPVIEPLSVFVCRLNLILFQLVQANKFIVVLVVVELRVVL